MFGWTEIKRKKGERIWRGEESYNKMKGKWFGGIKWISFVNVLIFSGRKIWRQNSHFTSFLSFSSKQIRFTSLSFSSIPFPSPFSFFSLQSRYHNQKANYSHFELFLARFKRIGYLKFKSASKSCNTEKDITIITNLKSENIVSCSFLSSTFG